MNDVLEINSDGIDERKMYEPKCLRMVSTGKSAKYLAVSVWLLVLAVGVCAMCVPWQQSISGIGQVIIFSPMERPQNIEAQIPGKIVSWKVRDGEVVKKDQLIAELKDIDSKFLDPHQLARLGDQRKALVARREAARERERALQAQMASLRSSQNASVPSSVERTKQSTNRIAQAEQQMEATRLSEVTTNLNLKRMEELFAKGLRSKRDLEVAQLEESRAKTDVERAIAAVEIAKRDRTLAELDQKKVLADTEAAMSNVMATIAQVHETIETVTSDISKLDIEVGNLSSRIAQRKILAPCAGRIVKLLKVGSGSTVDAGSILAVIAPSTEDLAVELIISDNDAPLVSVDRPVRIQFAGWPALQFAGWPSIAVGTFGGRVAVIDAVDNGKNSYRVIVKPDWQAIKEGKDEPWPKSAHLRAGAEASGWIMLDTVSLGFELWRQFNAFPPTVKPEELGLTQSTPETKESGSKIKRKGK